jgi:hypothetical protein
MANVVNVIRIDIKNITITACSPNVLFCVVPIPFGEKISHYMTMLLMLTVYLTILMDILPASTTQNKTLGEHAVIVMFFMSILITFTTLAIQIFVDDSMKFNKLP